MVEMGPDLPDTPPGHNGVGAPDAAQEYEFIERCNMGERVNNDFQFVEVARQEPQKRPLRHRKTRFIEINELFKPQEATEQAHRCLECGNPYCEWKCPVHNYIPNWLKLVSEGNIIEAAELAHPTN